MNASVFEGTYQKTTQGLNMKALNFYNKETEANATKEVPYLGL